MYQTEQKPEQQRTLQQNKALHLWFDLLADALNSAGLDMRKTLKPSVEIPWSGETVKEYMFKPVLKLQLNKDSTADMTTKEIDVVFDTINRHLGEKFGIHEDFPSIETLMLNMGEYATYYKKVKKPDRPRHIF